MKHYRTRSIQNIIDELIELQMKGYTHVAFVDDCFPSNKKQANTLFDTIIDNNIDIRFYITAARVDSADETLYKKMKKAGVVFIQYGLESGNQDILDFYNKHTTLDQMKYAVHLSHATGFFTTGSFIIGAPFETKQHIQKTISFAKSLPLDSVSFLPLRYMAGSDLWKKAVQQGNISEDEYLVEADSTRNLAVLSREEIIQYCKQLEYMFYFRPTFILNLLVSSLRQQNSSILQSYLSVLSSFFFKRQISPERIKEEEAKF